MISTLQRLYEDGGFVNNRLNSKSLIDDTLSIDKTYREGNRRSSFTYFDRTKMLMRVDDRTDFTRKIFVLFICIYICVITHDVHSFDHTSHKKFGTSCTVHR